MHISSSRCRDRAGSSLSTEIWTAHFEQKSIRQPSRQKYNAAYSDKPIQRQLRTQSSESGAPRNRIIRNAKSVISSLASAQAPSKQHSCHAYRITHSRYRGHRRRRINDSVNSAGNRQIPSYSFPLTFQDTALVQHPQKSRIAGLIWKRHPRRQQTLCAEGNTQVESIYDHYTCFIYLYTACPWIGHVK